MKANTPQIKKWQAEALLDLNKYREGDKFENTNSEVEIEVWKLRVYQHKINDLCSMLLDDLCDRLLDAKNEIDDMLEEV